MAILLIEGFDGIATADLTKKGYILSGTPAVIAGGRNGANCLRHNTNSSRTAINYASSATIYLGCAFKKDTGVAQSNQDNRSLLTIYNVNGTQIVFAIDSSNIISVYRGSTGTLLGSASQAIIDSIWYYLEIAVNIHSTTGSVLVKINGVTVINLTGQNTQATGSSNDSTKVDLGLGYNASGNVPFYFDDLVLDDATNHGDCRVDTISPDGAGNSTQFTPSAGSNYQCVDEIPPSASDYVESSTVGHKDLYAFAALPSGSSIKGLQLNILAEKTDVDARTIRAVVRSNAVDYNGSSLALSQGSDIYLKSVWAIDPDTAAAWTESGVNAAQFGQDITV